MVNEEHLTRLKHGVVSVLARARQALTLGAAYVYLWGRTWIAEQQVGEGIRRISQRAVARLRTTPWRAIALRHWKLLLLIVAVIAVGIVWKGPQWQAASWEGLMEPKDLAKLQNDARTTLLQALGGLILLSGLGFTLWNLQLTQDRQITERYTRAVEQLGSDKLELRLGAIYALECIARDSERDHWPIMEILTAYVREHAPWKETEQRSKEEGSSTETPPTQTHEPLPKPTTDVQAVLTVLGRRTRTYGKGEEQPLNLSSTDLRGANLLGAHLERVALSGAHLERAFLINAHLEGTVLLSANLEFARMRRAHLEGTRFFGAHLLGTFLTGAHMKGADLTDANLQWADLRGATDLTVEQLADAKTLYEAHLDLPLLEQIQQRYPHLLEESEAT